MRGMFVDSDVHRIARAIKRSIRRQVGVPPKGSKGYGKDDQYWDDWNQNSDCASYGERWQPFTDPPRRICQRTQYDRQVTWDDFRRWGQVVVTCGGVIVTIRTGANIWTVRLAAGACMLSVGDKIAHPDPHPCPCPKAGSVGTVEPTSRRG